MCSLKVVLEGPLWVNEGLQIALEELQKHFKGVFATACALTPHIESDDHISKLMLGKVSR